MDKTALALRAILQAVRAHGPSVLSRALGPERCPPAQLWHHHLHCTRSLAQQEVRLTRLARLLACGGSVERWLVHASRAVGLHLRRAHMAAVLRKRKG